MASAFYEEYKVYSYILQYLYLFLIGSVSGFGIEVLYRRYVSVKRWVNPGFMKGPWIPLYGFGVVLMSAITTSSDAIFRDHGITLYNPNNLYNLGQATGPTPYDLVPILIMGVGMTVLELIAGLIFVKGFRVRLWDYSNDRGNFMGIICPKFSIIWVLVAILFYYCISPYVYSLSVANTEEILRPALEGGIPKIWIVLLLGLVYGIILYDFATSIGLFNKASAAAKKIGKIFHYDMITESMSILRKETSEELKSMLPDDVRANFEHYQKYKAQAALSKDSIRNRIRSLLYIDPNKKSDNNFDENGRPISDDKPSDENSQNESKE